LAVAAVSVYAQDAPEAGGRPGRMHARWGGPLRVARALNLTEEQRASVKALMEEHHQSLQPLREQERDLRQQIRQQLDGGSADPTTIGQLTIQAHAVGQQLHQSHAALMERFQALLTPEQKARLEQLKSERGRPRFQRGKVGSGTGKEL
jgi:Spy/CpxP family protein refolding chaperone